MKRSSGILLPIFSLPSKYGIGTIGKEAYKFVDFLSAAKQSYWQILPVGPTSFGNSPYQSFSTFAGNPYFIDFDLLIEDGLLKKTDLNGLKWQISDDKIEYEMIYKNRFKVLKKAFKAGFKKDRELVNEFVNENSWVKDYSLFMALKQHFDMKCWSDWEDEGIRLHKKDSVERYSAILKDEIDFYTYIQFIFYKQWDKFKNYANENGVKIIGDIPIYVAFDSADVWANPEYFMLDEKNIPIEIAGVPPDYFSKTGQLWGNPLYNWELMKNEGYGWWIRRIGGAAKLYDVIRIDHFRGFESYWAVPFGEETAVNGKWRKGPGLELVSTLTNWFHDTEFIAEDLGLLTPEVFELLEKSGLPGMKVLEFAFDSKEPSNYLPHVYNNNCICYTGTHDNTTVSAWKAEAKKADIKYACDYLNISDEAEFNYGVIKGGMRSVANLFIAQLQDYLELGKESRINTPGTSENNWQWRMRKGMINKSLANRIAALTKMYGRA